jgi:hypothetical protein
MEELAMPQPMYANVQMDMPPIIAKSQYVQEVVDKESASPLVYALAIQDTTGPTAKTRFAIRHVCMESVPLLILVIVLEPDILTAKEDI